MDFNDWFVIILAYIYFVLHCGFVVVHLKQRFIAVYYRAAPWAEY